MDAATIQIIADIIKTVGFPVAVATYVLWQDGSTTRKQSIAYKKSDPAIKVRAMIEKATTKV